MDKNKLNLLGLSGYLKLSFAESISKLLKQFWHHFDLEISIKLKGYEYPVWIRCGTSDYACFHLIFIQEEFKEIKKMLNHNTKYMIDCGSNVGYTIKYFAENVPQLTIIGVEPDESNYLVALKNTGYYSDRVQIIPKAIWHKATKVKVIEGDFGDGGKWALKVEETTDLNGIEAITLNHIVDQLKTKDIFVKIDIEGAEKVVLAKNTEWINHVDLLSVELHDAEAEIVFNALVKKHELIYKGLFKEMHVVKKVENLCPQNTTLT